MTKSKSKPADDRRAVYVRMERELVSWTDQEAKRQRRSRAYVISEALRVLRAVIEQMEAERAV